MYFAINLQVFGRNFRTLFRNCRILCFWRSAQFFGQKIQKLQNLKLFLEINIKLLSFLYTIFVCNGSKIMEFHGFIFKKSPSVLHNPQKFVLSIWKKVQLYCYFTCDKICSFVIMTDNLSICLWQ